MMTERENALRIMKGIGDPEWIPAAGDCIQFTFPSPATEAPHFFESGTDGFGCKWIWDQGSFGHAPNVKEPPVIDDILNWREKLVLPELDNVDWEAVAARDTAEVDRENKVIRLFMQTGVFERANTLLGFENAYIAMMEEPEEYKALVEALADYKIKVLNYAIPLYKPDEVFFQDDLGSSRGPLISLDTYRELIKPAHKRIFETVHSYGVSLTLHSCGCMAAFLDDLVEIGIDGINPLQAINNWKAVAEKYGDKLYYIVGSEGRANYEGTTEEMLRQDVQELIDALGATKRLIVDVFMSNTKLMHNAGILTDEIHSYGRSFYRK